MQSTVPPKSDVSQNDLYLSRNVRAVLGNISDMTLWRWLNDPAYAHLNFPRPIIIGKRRFWKQREISNFIAEQSSKGAAWGLIYISLIAKLRNDTKLDVLPHGAGLNPVIFLNPSNFLRVAPDGSLLT